MSIDATSGGKEVEISEYEHGIKPKDQSEGLRYCDECDERRFSRLPSGLCYPCNREARRASEGDDE